MWVYVHVQYKVQNMFFVYKLHVSCVQVKCCLSITCTVSQLPALSPSTVHMYCIPYILGNLRLMEIFRWVENLQKFPMQN